MFDEPRRVHAAPKELVLFHLPKARLTASMLFTSSGHPQGVLDLRWERRSKKEKLLTERLNVDDGIYMGMMRIGLESQWYPGPYTHVGQVVHIHFPNAVCEFELDLKTKMESVQFFKNCGLW